MELWSVDYYVALIEKHATTRHDARIVMLSAVEQTLLMDPDDIPARVHNILAAGNQTLPDLR